MLSTKRRTKSALNIIQVNPRKRARPYRPSKDLSNNNPSAWNISDRIARIWKDPEENRRWDH